jgi:hypothetical protein
VLIGMVRCESIALAITRRTGNNYRVKIILIQFKITSAGYSFNRADVM